MTGLEKTTKPPNPSDGAEKDLPTGYTGNWFTRHVVVAAISLLWRFRPRRRSVLFLTSKICVKHHYLMQLCEAEAMRFIARNTSIPVPKVYCAFKRKGVTYIVMERIKGQDIRTDWSQRSSESREALLLELRRMVDEMRSLPPPHEGFVGAADLTKLYDDRIRPGAHS